MNRFFETYIRLACAAICVCSVHLQAHGAEEIKTIQLGDIVIAIPTPLGYQRYTIEGNPIWHYRPSGRGIHLSMFIPNDFSKKEIKNSSQLWNHMARVETDYEKDISTPLGNFQQSMQTAKKSLQKYQLDKSLGYKNIRNKLAEFSRTTPGKFIYDKLINHQRFIGYVALYKEKKQIRLAGIAILFIRGKLLTLSISTLADDVHPDDIKQSLLAWTFRFLEANKTQPTHADYVVGPRNKRLISDGKKKNKGTNHRTR